MLGPFGDPFQGRKARPAFGWTQCWAFRDYLAKWCRLLFESIFDWASQPQGVTRLGEAL